MQPILIEKPYRFIPPVRSEFWPWVFQRFRLYEPHLRRREGVVAYECRHADRLRQSLDRRCGVLLTPNHCRTADPVVLGWLAKEVGTAVYAMASWHLFHQDWLTTWALRRMGAFSVHREGIDRQAINLAIEILDVGDRPLIVFPEGGVSRTNDRLLALLDIALIPRAAARRRVKRGAGAGVVVHPIAIKYRFSGNLDAAADRVLTDIEHRLSWRPQRQLGLIERIGKLGRALLSLKEIEYFGQPQTGALAERLSRLIDRLLHPLEREWLGELGSGPVVPRVKAVRIKIMPDLVEGRAGEAERERRWQQLADLYLAQQLACYPPDYLQEYPSVDRLLETVERFEEDLTDRATVHGSLTAVIEVGEAIAVEPERDRASGADPLMGRVEAGLQAMLDRLARESPLYQPTAG